MEPGPVLGATGVLRATCRRNAATCRRDAAKCRRDAALAQFLPVLCLLVLAGGLAWSRHLRLRESAPAREPRVWVDPASARVTRAPAWVDPRWLEHLQDLLSQQDPFVLGTQVSLESLAARLGALSFVERVECCAATPAGLALELTLREPVACIAVGGEFALVDEDGVVLEGRWPLPPRLGRAYLPVLGPLDEPLFARARAGDWLCEPEHTDALDVALSLNAHLGAPQRAAVGRIVIDARSARRASVSEPGVRLELEGSRLALFGRAPCMNEPGELAAASKWQALARALELFEHDPVGGDWDLVDLRWDRPDLALCDAPVVASLAAHAGAAPVSGRTTRARRERDDSRARVR